MNGKQIRISPDKFDRIDYFRKKLIEKDARLENISLGESFDIMCRIGEMKLLDSSETDEILRSYKSIKRLSSTNNIMKKRNGNKFIIELANKPSIFIDRKGSNQDMIYIAIFILIAALVGYFAIAIWNPIYTSQSEPGGLFNQSAATRTVGKAIDASMSVWDFIVPLFLIVGTVIISLLVYQNQIPAAFMVFAWLFLPILLFIAAVIKSTYTNAVDNSTIFTGIIARMALTDHIMRNFPAYIIIMYLLFGIVQYARSRQSVAIA